MCLITMHEPHHNYYRYEICVLLFLVVCCEESLIVSQECDGLQ